MKILKVFCLSAVAAVAMIALAGVGAASATQLCSAHPEGEKCKAGTSLGTGTVTFMSKQLGEQVITFTGGSIACKAGSGEGTVKGGGEATLTGSPTGGSLSECVSTVPLCKGAVTFTGTAVPEIQLKYTEVGVGAFSQLKPATTVKMPCGIECKYGENDTITGQVLNLFEGKALPVSRVEKAAITGPGGGLCPKSGTISVTSELSYLKEGKEAPVFIAKE